MQKMFCGQKDQVVKQVNELLNNGWTVVPGTIVLNTEEYVPQYTRGVPTSTKNTAFMSSMAIVLQKDE